MEHQSQALFSTTMAPGRVTPRKVAPERPMEANAGTSAADRAVPGSSKRGMEGTSNAASKASSVKRQRVNMDQNLERIRACDKSLEDLGETELRLLSVAAYLDPHSMPRQVFEKFCQLEEEEVKEALKKLVSLEILRDESKDTLVYNMGRNLQKEIRKVIHNEPDMLFNLISIFESEINSKNTVESPYMNYIRHINLCAMEVWDYVCNHSELVEKCWKSLELIVTSAVGESQSTGTILLFLSKSVRVLSKLFGCNDTRTINLRIRRLIITSENGKRKEALIEIDQLIELITKSNDNQLKLLWIKAIEVKVELLAKESMYLCALQFCGQLLEKKDAKYNENEIISLKHMKCKMLLLMGSVSNSVDVCEAILKYIRNHDALKSYENIVRCTLVQCYVSQKNFQSALNLMKVVLESRTKQLEPTNCLVLAARSEIVEILMAMKRFREALVELRCIIKLKREKYAFDPNHSEILKDKIILARIYYHIGRKKKVSSLIDSISNGMGSSKSDRHTFTDAGCQLKNLIVDSANLKTDDEVSSSSEEENSKQGSEEQQKEEELELVARSLEKRYHDEMLKFGESNPKTRSTLDELADLQYKLNNHAAALVYYENLYKNHSVDDKKSIEYLYKISDLQLKLFQYHKSLKNFETVCLNLRNRTDCKKLQFDATYGLALCNLRLTNVEEAWNISRQLLEDTQRVLKFKVLKYENLAKFCQDLLKETKKK